MIHIMQRRAPHVSMKAMQSQHAADEAYPDTHLMALQWGYCSLACDASHVTWSDWRPGYVELFRKLMPSLRARHAVEMGYTLQYCSQDNSRASTDCGSLTRYMHRGASDGAFKALCTS